eukprot:14616668-Ditylum_brightwellii.AAC.1
MEKQISAVIEVLGIPASAASVLMRALKVKFPSSLLRERDGGFAPEDMIAMPCGHEYCRDCWRGFINNMLKEGTECLNYTCPRVGCNEKVTEEE